MLLHVGAARNKIELNRGPTKLLHQQRFGLAEVEELLNRSAILLPEIITMPAVERIGLLEGRHPLVGNEIAKVAMEVVGQYQNLISGWLHSPRLHLFQALWRDTGDLGDFGDRLL